jgi:DNA-directed RNA polymerase specialized sigma24 family protein
LAVDDAEFREFFASQYARLCWLGCALTASPAQAEELAQEALVRTWWRWRLVGRPQDPASYARRVLVNRHRSLLRRAATEARSFARIGLEQAAMPVGDERAMVLCRPSRTCRCASGACWCCGSTRTSPRPRWRDSSACRSAR